MLRVMRGGFELGPELGRFRDYLRSVTNREISAQIRRRKLSSPLITDPGAEDGTWAELERQEVLAVCLERLRRSRAVRARDLLAFERYALQNEPADSVARDLQISKSRLYAIKHEMIQRLRRLRESLEAAIEEAPSRASFSVALRKKNSSSSSRAARRAVSRSTSKSVRPVGPLVSGCAMTSGCCRSFAPRSMPDWITPSVRRFCACVIAHPSEHQTTQYYEHEVPKVMLSEAKHSASRPEPLVRALGRIERFGGRRCHNAINGQDATAGVREFEGLSQSRRPQLSIARHARVPAW